MRVALLAVCAAVLWNTPVFAEVSEDLKFCGALQSSRERLACYDAAARIAQRPRVQPASTIAPTATLEAQASIPRKARGELLVLEQNKFAGTSVAVGGGYGVETGRSASVYGSYSGGVTSLPLTSPVGGFGAVTINHDIAIGTGIVGVEFSGRFEGERETNSAIVPAATFTPSVGSAYYSYSLKNDIGLHASVRAGLTFDDVLIFGKVGVGASRVSETFIADERGISLTYCSPGVFACYSPSTPPPTIRSVSATSWVPSALFGLGVERNWGSFFGRLGADFEAINLQELRGAPAWAGSSSSQITWATRGTALIGYRF